MFIFFFLQIVPNIEIQQNITKTVQALDRFYLERTIKKNNSNQEIVF
jgi:hypothetical protein